MQDYEERDREADRIAEMYLGVEDELIALLVAAWAAGIPAEMASAATVAKNLLAEAHYQTQVWDAEAIPFLYGEPNALSDVTVPIIAEMSQTRFTDMTATASRRIDDLVRDFDLADARRRALTALQEEQSALSVKELARTMEEGLREGGITAFTDAAGRKWKLNVYADMAARTTTMDAQLSGIKDRALSAGRDLVEIVGPLDYPDGCPPAVLGGPYSLTGATPGVMTLDAAVQFYGVFHPRCVVGDTLVSGPRPLAVSTRWYEGEFIVITTSLGKQLTITPNHPVLTSEGWVAAGELHVGGDVICGVFSDDGTQMGVDPYDEQVPSRIEDVAASLGQALGMTTMSVPTTAEDFHGDGFAGEVDVVLAECHLRNGVDAALAEHEREVCFVGAHLPSASASFGSSATFLESDRPATHRSVGGLGESSPLFLGHTRQSHAHGLRTVGRRHDAPFTQALVDGHVRYPETLSDVMLRLSSQVTTDHIVGIERESRACHVYNLQTDCGFYVSNGIVTHNCRHSIVQVG